MNADRGGAAHADAAISTHGLSKDYGGGHGLFDLDLDVERGEIFGFLGPNGAGKSTTMRLLLDLIRPTSGSTSILGLDTRSQSLEVRRRNLVILATVTAVFTLVAVLSIGRRDLRA